MTFKGWTPRNGMRPVAPYEVLRDEFGIIAHDLRGDDVPVDAGMAAELASVTGTTAEFWLNLQAAYDRARSRA